MTHTSVTIQIAPEAMPSTPSWFGEVATFAQVFQHIGQLEAIKERVRFARARGWLTTTRLTLSSSSSATRVG